MFYTSGTTGLPKGVVVPHRATGPRVEQQFTLCGLRPGTHNRFIGHMPLCHAIGYHLVFLAALSTGASYHLLSSFDATRVVAVVEAERITHLWGSPAHYYALLGATNFSCQGHGLAGERRLWRCADVPQPASAHGRPTAMPGPPPL